MAETDEQDGEQPDVFERMHALLDEMKEGSKKDEEPKEYKGKTIQDAEREAYVRVRAHVRQRKADKANEAPGA